MALDKNKLCCEQHVDAAIDDYINEYETFPNMDKAEDGKCDYCEDKAEYIIGN